MRAKPVTRRRAIAIFAATAAGFAARMEAAQSSAAVYEWKGLALGADARLIFAAADEASVRDAVTAAVAEIERLERALSLFRADSEICQLNRDGILDMPSGDLHRALTLALAIAEATGGLFDPTVQALWEAYVDWFAASPEAWLPPETIVAAARAHVDWRAITLASDRVSLRPGQRLTLNGLGQGYVTDRVADLLRMRGFGHILVDLGEQRAVGPRADGTPWLIARTGAAPIPLMDGALATSEAAGCVLGAQGAAHHLFDPRTGRCAAHWRRIIVHHRSAAVADALSTALSAASGADIGHILRKLRGVTVWATDQNGGERQWAA